MDLSTWVPLPAQRTATGFGMGLAVCPVLSLLVTTSTIHGTLSAYRLPSVEAMVSQTPSTMLDQVCTLGGPSSPAPMQFDFCGGGAAALPASGYLAFTGPATTRLLLVTDSGHGAVHVINVVAREHVGYVAGPGTLAGPRGLAAKDSLVAVTAWSDRGSGEHVVVLFEGSGATWSVVRVLGGGFGAPGAADGQLCKPCGLRFTGDGSGLVVADHNVARWSAFRVEDGAWVGHRAEGLPVVGLWDVEECGGGWVLALYGHPTLVWLGSDGRRGSVDLSGPDLNLPTALAVVPGVGLAVRAYDEVLLFATPEAVAMASMSRHRVAWVAAVARAAWFGRHGLEGP